MRYYEPETWLEDQDGHHYHVKLNAIDEPYIVDACLNKSVFLDLTTAMVGDVIDCTALFYGRYTITRIGE